MLHRGIVGLPLWDLGQKSANEVEYHTQDVDLSEPENELARGWSIREVNGAIDFALRVNADAVVLHPGTDKPKSGRFWPKSDEALQITNNRRVIFTQSLVELLDHFVRGVRDLEDKVARYDEKNPWLVAELRGLMHQLELSGSDERVRLPCLAEIIRIIDGHRIPIWMVRYCKNPSKRLSLVLENVEPPNFLCCTPRQHVGWLHRMREIFTDLCEREHLSSEFQAKYRPYLVLNPNHLLNAKVILTQPTNRPIAHIFEDYDDLYVAFVTLPSDMPSGGDGRVIEPLLNRYVREHSDDFLYAHLAGSQRMDYYMTTHDPIKSFRTKMYVQTDPNGRPLAKYSTGAFDPEVELNLEEVVQILGFDKTYVLEIQDSPEETVIASWVHTSEYLDHLHRECARAHELVLHALREAQAQSLQLSSRPDEVAQRFADAGRMMEALGRARFYMRPHRKARELWKVGHDEAGFYVFDPAWIRGESLSTVDIFATVKDGTQAVWIKGLEGRR
ncbi:MAG: hypothetical protein HY815_03645 [Candidatus Riflebacteria bacterium]|nr:hypothetical protein [Candidatus Riflebacteria bacterium]